MANRPDEPEEIPARPVRPRRSALYMPGANARALEKGRELPADVLIMDLEDGVLPDAKVEARGRVLGFLAEGGYGAREIVVRINGAGTPWFENDLSAVATSGADAVMLPKVEDPATVAQAAATLEAAGAPSEMGIWCMLETPKGILDARLIAGAHPRMAALTLGTADLSKALQSDLHAPRPAALAHQHRALPARRAGGPGSRCWTRPISTCRTTRASNAPAGRERASDSTANRCCTRGPSPSPTPCSAHRRPISHGPARISAAWRAAAAEGKGVTLVDGKLIEALHVEEAERTLALAEGIAALERGVSAAE